MRALRVPKESGLLSLWLATLIYALLKVRTWNLPVLASLAGSIVLLLLSDEILHLIASRRIKKLINQLSVVLILYIPLLLVNPMVLFLGLITVPFIVIILLSTSPDREITHGSTIAGSAAVAMHSPVLMISGGELDPAYLMIPPLYSIMATSHASIRVLGCNLKALLSGIVAVAILISITLPSPALAIVILVDISSRLLQEVTGLSSRVRVRTFGFIEFARSCLTLAVSALVG